jgi:hypothetical protein
MLPHVIVQVIFGHKSFLAYLTDVGFQTLVNNPERKEIDLLEHEKKFQIVSGNLLAEKKQFFRSSPEESYRDADEWLLLICLCPAPSDFVA